ncbi:ABC transporter permease [Microbacterium hydrocarbonoxydans]|uniref:Peptide/nickel transport system permease protein n=1 Tax=Microbacterium hydrocarbonoxydans TaxID=273678 RepID=A0A1H4L7Q7_9MICO|nr:ABC transporter permease [Microbacterium hydrocarbonoxydans]SEB66212.1 peptide/nickel transport system permease protein [Microbacterium hydrocarbonoxydans]
MSVSLSAAMTARIERPRRRANWIVALSWGVVAVITLLALFGNILAPIDPYAQDLATGPAGPSFAHPLGTDALGRDVLSRVIAGTSSAVVGPLVVAVGAAIIGNALGLLAGYRGGRIDSAIMRWVDLMFSLPSILVIIVFAGTFGGGYWTSVLLLTIMSAPADARIIRGATLEQAPRPYVEAARSIGVSDSRIMFTHIWPNVAPITIANLSLSFAGSLVALAGLSFLGLGVAAGTADWGLMVSESRNLLFVNPVAVLAPAVLIVAAATAVSVVGDWLHERLSTRGAGR